jgi:glycosyltransferase involved in cell wall biosynthesis
MTARPRVLIPSDNFDFVANFAGGYRRLGYDVAAGRINFEMEAAEYEVVHFLWPEELTDWRPPTAERIDEVLARLDRWTRHSRIIFSVNNLYPHRHEKNPAFHRLYTGFYQRADVIHHFSNASCALVKDEFPSIAGRNHIVRVGFNYERMLPVQPADRDEARRRLGLADDETVFLVFGTLRFWDEVELLRRAFKLANVAKKRLLLTAHYVEAGPRWKQRWRRWRWARWENSDGVTRVGERVPDAGLAGLFAAADAVVVIRHNSMSSGVPSMAMTFGRFVIAPDFGGMAEYLSGTDNVTYDQSSADALARALERAATVDRERIGRQNARIAAKWGWEPIVRACVDALPSGNRDQRKQYG